VNRPTPRTLAQVVLYLAFGLFLTVVFNVEFFSFSRKQLDLYDTFVKLKGEREVDPRILLVTVTRDLYEREGISWPIPLDYHTRVLTFLREAGAKVIGVDFHIRAQEYFASSEVLALCQAVEGAENIIWGREIAEDGVSLEELPECIQERAGDVFSQVFRSGDTIQEYRKYTRFTYGYYWVLNKKFVTLDLAVVSAYLGRDLSADPQYEQLSYVNFAGSRGRYPAVPMVDILSGQADPAKFKDKIVLYGVDDLVNTDFYHRTPFFKNAEGKFSMSRVEIHANIVDTLLNDNAHRFSSETLTSLLIFLVGALTCAMVFGTTPMPGILFLGFEFLSLVLLALTSLKLFGWYLNIFHPLMAVFISYYIFIPYRLIKESQARWKIEEEVKLLNKVEELKTNFLSLMTHDLKTPIARIQGLAEVILNEGGLSDAQRQSIDKILQSSDEFNDFITKILNFTKIESAGVQLNLASRDINALVKENVDILTYDASTKGIVLETDLEPLFPIKIDPDLIRQVIKNLIENAIKYSHPGTRIHVQTTGGDGKVVLRVRDQGVGIPKKDLENIFLKFYRIKDDRLAMAKGTGLGLYLVKYFIELHKGTIVVESEPPKGSTFIVTLPEE